MHPLILVACYGPGPAKVVNKALLYIRNFEKLLRTTYNRNHRVYPTLFVPLSFWMSPNTSCIKKLCLELCLKLLIFSWKKNIQLDVDKEGNLVKEKPNFAIINQEGIREVVFLSCFCSESRSFVYLPTALLRV